MRRRARRFGCRGGGVDQMSLPPERLAQLEELLRDALTVGNEEPARDRAGRHRQGISL
jgi:hypothetical protein